MTITLIFIILIVVVILIIISISISIRHPRRHFPYRNDNFLGISHFQGDPHVGKPAAGWNDSKRDGKQGHLHDLGNLHGSSFRACPTPGIFPVTCSTRHSKKNQHLGITIHSNDI